MEDTRGDRFTVQILHKLVRIQADLLRVISKHRDEVLFCAPGSLVFVELVVHLPELALDAGSFRGLSGQQRMVMHRHKRQLAKDYPQPFAIFGFDFLQFGIVRPAGTALEIAKLFQGYRSIHVASNVWRLSTLNLGRRIGRGIIRIPRLLRRVPQQPPTGQSNNQHNGNEYKWYKTPGTLWRIFRRGDFTCIRAGGIVNRRKLSAIIKTDFQGVILVFAFALWALFHKKLSYSKRSSKILLPHPVWRLVTSCGTTSGGYSMV